MRAGWRQWTARSLAAFAVAPAFCAVVLSAWILLSRAATGAHWRADLTHSLGIAVICYALVAILGVPIYLVFEILRLRRFWQYLLAGFAMGTGLMAATYLIIPVSGGPGPEHYAPIDWGQSAAFGLIGAATTGLFWWIRHGAPFGRFG